MITWSRLAINRQVDAVASMLDGGYLTIYGQDDQVSLAQLRLASPAFASAVDGVAVAHPMTPETDGRAGDAHSYRLTDALGPRPARKQVPYWDRIPITARGDLRVPAIISDSRGRVIAPQVVTGRGHLRVPAISVTAWSRGTADDELLMLMWLDEEAA